ncbi:hypothetical protein FWP28_18805 [Vibrio alginolyticus]|uniref:hypothetical protein n=1 Tax=Vibrio sp. Y176 TaxID=3074704 RepID=UPI001DE67CCF|nr:hypothetical protein [Vibrio sp. Y176]EGQ9716318.1 hypothetical protein [Vibrio alginolyticus]MDW1629048.1 hypothetical protein [Vibrio sp. Y176]
MTYLLRKINPNKWQPNLGKVSARHSADAITGCTRTTSNTLSVWHSDTKDFNDESVQNLIVGLAITMPQPAKIDLLWLEEDSLVAKGLKVTHTDPGSDYVAINSLHKDIEELDHEGLGIVSEHIVNQFSDHQNYKQVPRPVLISMVSEWVLKSDTFNLEDLNDNWLDAVQKYFENNPDATK